jgi:oxalate decarboxylase/phosphoglucose isomerase-like protein (cupin superfamily)
MATTTTLNRLEYHRVSPDMKGITHFDTVKVEQHLLTGAPPAAPFYISVDNPASSYRFYSFEPGWFGELHPAPARQFLILLSGMVEMETGDGMIQKFEPGDIVLLEDTWGPGHRTRNIGEGYADFLVVPASVS